MRYDTLIESENKVNYVYKYTPAKKLSEKITAMAVVEVYNRDGKKINGYGFSRAPKNQFDDRVTEMVTELIREYEISKIWNKKG